MFGTSGKTAWRLLAAVPFVLLLGIVGIKVTAGDPSSPFNKIPGAQTIQELGDEAPSTNVTVKLPKTKKPSPSSTTSNSATASASASASTSASASASASRPAPVTTTKKPSPKPTPTATSGGGSSTPTPTPTETRSANQIKCESNGGHWRYNQLFGWHCSAL